MLEARLFGLSDIRPELAFWAASVHLTRCCIVSLWQGLWHTERLANHGYICLLAQISTWRLYTEITHQSWIHVIR